MAVKDEVIKAMREAGKPMSAGDVAKATGIDRAEIDKAFKELKAENAIVSPVRCKWEPARRRKHPGGHLLPSVNPYF